MEFVAVRLDVKDYIATVTIDRPPVNAMSSEMVAELIAIFDSLSDRDDVRVAILTAAGKVFCAGADIKARVNKTFEAGDRWSHNRSMRELPLSIMECKKPVIAAINGPAVGGGVAIVTCCDILIASERAELVLNEINVGLLGGMRHAMRLFSQSRLRRMAYTGYRVTGAELYRTGVCEACVPQEELMSAALAIATEIAGKSPVAVRLAKLAINTVEEMSLRDGYRFEQEMTASLSQYDDSKEAMRAFLERRKGSFTGR